MSIFSIATLLLYSCNRKENYVLEKSLNRNFSTEIRGIEIKESDANSFSVVYQLENITFLYTANMKGSITTSSLTIVSEQNVVETEFIINTELEGFKYLIHGDVIMEAERIKNTFSVSEAEKIARLYEVFGRSLLSQDVQRQSQLIQSLFFHNAILNVVSRSLKNKEDCECTPDPGYYVDKTSFWCQEDYYVNPMVLIDRVDKGNYVMGPNEKKVYDYLKRNKNESWISLDRLFDVMIPKKAYMERVNFYTAKYDQSIKNDVGANITQLKQFLLVENSECLNGGQFGCCGNYDGCCWYYNGLCFWHDIICLCCDSWYCLWGCVPEPGC